MKLKEFFYLLGLKPRPKTFGYVVEPHRLAGEGAVDVARWLHPRAYSTTPRQAAVDQLRRFLRPGDVAIDIGAHTGDSTLPIALAVGPTGVVLALEPNPHVFEVLRQNAGLNPGKTRIVPLMFAAMRADGHYDFEYGEPGFCNGGFHEGMSRWLHGSAFTLRVEGRDLAQVMRRDYAELMPRLRFIKVDAEGFDLAVLETIEALIRERRPYLQVEFFKRRKSLPGYRLRLFRFLTGLDYTLYRMEGDANYFGDRVTEDTLDAWESADVLGVPPDASPLPPPAR